MSRRHQASRRKAYGRRQHELRERFERYPLSELVDPRWLEKATAAPEAFAFLEPRSLRLAMGD